MNGVIVRWVLAVACLGFTGCAWAGCEVNFSTHATPQGATMYAVQDTYQGVPPQTMLQRIAKAAQASGFLVVRPVTMDGGDASLVIGTRAPPSYPVMASAHANGMVILIALINPGMQVAPLALRDRMCGLMAHVGSPDATDHGDAAGAGATSVGPITDASRTALPAAAQPQRQRPAVLAPDIPFDIDAAKRDLEPGTATIRGSACGFYGRIKGYPSTVVLLPATPYMRQVFKLMEENPKGLRNVQVAPMAMATTMVAKTSGALKGHFQFSRMKPGSYYVFATLTAASFVTYQQKVGSVSGTVDGFLGPDNYSANIYQQKEGIGAMSTPVYQLVDVPQDGATVDVKLRPVSHLHWLVGGWSATHMLSSCD